MAEITAAMVMKLRDETGLPMMECKKALQESGGDFELAKQKARESGNPGLHELVACPGPPLSRR